MEDRADSEAAIRQIRRNPGDAGPADVDRLLAALDGESEKRRRDAAVALARVSDTSPELLSDCMATLGSHLDASPLVRGMVAQSIAAVAVVSPEAAAAATTDLRACLDVDYAVTETAALTALTEIVRVDPAAVVPLVPELRAVVASDSGVGEGTSRALFVLGETLPEAPDAVAPVVPDLLDLVDTVPADVQSRGGSGMKLDDVVEAEYEDLALQQASARKLASVLLARVAEKRPAAVAAQVGAVADALDDDDHLVRKAAVDALRAVATSQPVAFDGSIRPLVDRLTNEEDDEIRGRVAAILGLVALELPDSVVTDSEAVVTAARTLFDDDRPEVRTGAAGLLSSLAAVAPGTITPAVPDLRARLDDDEAAVRGQAIWALRDGAVGEIRDDLRRVAETDPDPAIRALARDSLDELESGSTDSSD